MKIKSKSAVSQITRSPDHARSRRSQGCYNPCVFKLTFMFMLALTAGAQQAPKKDTTQGKSQVRVNYLNVCTPSDEEQPLPKAVFDPISASPPFPADFDIS